MIIFTVLICKLCMELLDLTEVCLSAPSIHSNIIRFLFSSFRTQVSLHMWFVMTPENRTLVYELSCHGLYVWYPIAFSVKITSLIWWNLGYLCVLLFSSNTMKFFLKDNIYSRLFYVSILEWRRVWLKTESCGGGWSPLLPQFLYGSLVNIERPITGWIGMFHTLALTK